MSAEDNLIIYAGEGFDATTLQYGWEIDGVAVNLTGYTARAQIRTAFNSATSLASWTTENGKIVLGGALGTVTLVVSDTETAALWVAGLALCGRIDGRGAYMLGYFDLELIPPSSAVRRFIQGEAWIIPEATQ